MAGGHQGQAVGKTERQIISRARVSAKVGIPTAARAHVKHAVAYVRDHVALVGEGEPELRSRWNGRGQNNGQPVVTSLPHGLLHGIALNDFELPVVIVSNL